jgi:UDP-N-acetylglucosamine transferase subunit ALG13
VVPRLFARGEHYDDHQSEITAAFKTRGLVQEARTEEEFAAALAQARQAVPVHATSDPEALRIFLDRSLPILARRRQRSATMVSNGGS